jgi:hypothetical protein
VGNAAIVVDVVDVVDVAVVEGVVVLPVLVLVEWAVLLMLQDDPSGLPRILTHLPTTPRSTPGLRKSSRSLEMTFSQGHTCNSRS